MGRGTVRRWEGFFAGSGLFGDRRRWLDAWGLCRPGAANAQSRKQTFKGLGVGVEAKARFLCSGKDRVCKAGAC